MKFLILLFYYERPELLKNALSSVKSSTYKDWDLCVIDDGTKFPAFNVINECFSSDERMSHKITYIQTFDSEERKKTRGGSQFGEYANSAIKTSDAEIVLMLCDDDLLKPDYMQQLNEFYINNPDVKYSYAHLDFYDPTIGLPSESNMVSDGYTKYLVRNTDPINPVRKVDSSQVSWRRRCWLDDDILFPCPRTSNLDEVIYGHMYVAWGECVFNGINSQWKGIHEGQLINLARKDR
jgi:glycosyltransferase involved in cell wall biosynthesis